MLFRSALTITISIIAIIGEIFMVTNYLRFAKGISYHRHIPVALELSLLIVLAVIISVLVCVTISGNRVTRFIVSFVIAATFFYNFLDFFLALALLGADNWRDNTDFFVGATLVCAIKILYVKNIFTQKDIRAYFYKVLKSRYGL